MSKCLEDELFDIYVKDNTIIASLKEIYAKGRADKYQEIVSEHMLLTEEQVAEIRADAIEEFTQALHTQFEQNKALAKSCSHGNRVKELALTNIDLEEVDNIAEQLKE